MLNNSKEHIVFCAEDWADLNATFVWKIIHYSKLENGNFTRSIIIETKKQLCNDLQSCFF